MTIYTVEDIARLLVAKKFDIGGEDLRTRYGNVRITRQGDLALFNYTPQAAFDNKWRDILTRCFIKHRRLRGKSLQNG